MHVFYGETGCSFNICEKLIDIYCLAHELGRMMLATTLFQPHVLTRRGSGSGKLPRLKGRQRIYAPEEVVLYSNTF